MGEGERTEYPWQIPLSEWTPGGAKMSEAERRRDEAENLFEIELEARKHGFPSELLYEAEADVFRFQDGRFALSREHADWAGLKAIGYFRAWGM